MTEFSDAAAAAAAAVESGLNTVFDVEESNTMAHARRELKLLGEDPDVIKGYLDMIQIFVDMEHSGSSASIFISNLVRLLWQENLTPLTDDPDEWFHHTSEALGEPGGVWQNIRNGEAFSADGGKTYTLRGIQRVSSVKERESNEHNYC